MSGKTGRRRSDFDVTDTVRVSSTAAVRDAVRDLVAQAFPRAAFDTLWLAFHDFDQLFCGRWPGFTGCDTVYHDRQHTLDMTLAMARLVAGHDAAAPADERLGAQRATLGLVAALFHDAGYIRRADEDTRRNGAEFTAWHVSRSAAFLEAYLPRLGLGHLAGLAGQLVHFTGYEVNLDDIELEDPRDTLVGHLLGTADLIAQMADRCYLEKCRDRLYSEFVIAGIATRPAGDGRPLYASGIELLRKTPEFWASAVGERLDRRFNRAWRHVEPLFGGRNPYMEAIERNLEHLHRLIEADDWRALRRRPPCFTVLDAPAERVSALVSRQLIDGQMPARA